MRQVAPTTVVPISTGFAVALNALLRAVVLFEIFLGAFEIGSEAELRLELHLYQPGTFSIKESS